MAKRFFLIGCAVLLGVVAARAAGPTVSGVSALQRSGTTYVDITYNLADADSATLAVTVEISTNGGAAYFTPAALTGDVGASVARGNNKQVAWNAGAALPARLFNNVRARVTANDEPVPSGMALIPAGSFVMGATTNVGHESYSDEKPQHTVNVSAFYMDRYEVTKALWDDVKTWALANGYAFENAGSGKAVGHPAHTMNWYDAVKWCNARSQREGLTACYTTNGLTYKTGNNSNVVCNWAANGYRLPTEAEWEKAARGGTANHRFPWSDSDNIQHARANYYSRTNYIYDTSPTRGYHPTFNDGVYPYTSPVGYFGANGYGLYDMAGNVWEWCWDWYSSSYYATSSGTDPRGAASGSYRVLRGGGWSDDAFLTRVAYRYGYYVPTYESVSYGFRCARGL